MDLGEEEYPAGFHASWKSPRTQREFRNEVGELYEKLLNKPLSRNPVLRRHALSPIAFALKLYSQQALITRETLFHRIIDGFPLAPECAYLETFLLTLLDRPLIPTSKGTVTLKALGVQPGYILSPELSVETEELLILKEFFGEYRFRESSTE